MYVSKTQTLEHQELTLTCIDMIKRVKLTNWITYYTGIKKMNTKTAKNYPDKIKFRTP